ncbi:hypothetical protein AKJ36_01250 [candidate division MSBL1 archaeon SCGC-AAA259I07]|uniref:site-specific DNA-methyltransferase (adenine-specific) n=1 Tax=candidate division MSBL1 archaeon SCGC-AAA259I07 TaxID=1698266 RepID=A0A133UM31_9EURY|nr:hypothetical protein AKJ36_01250 [candidate division MSBL1 archaeon SCGC-AAA259I07]
MDIKETRKRVQELVQAYDQRKEEYRHEDYNESEVRADFIDPFFEALGWDVDNRKGRPRHLREVKREASVEDEESVKKPDYEFRDEEGNRKFFVEAKKPSISLTSQEPPLQIRRYGWNANLSISVLTNFEKLIFYDCTRIPEEGDHAHVGQIRTYEYDEYVEKLDELIEFISREAVVSGRFSEEFEIPAEKRETKTFDDFFLNQLEEWREKLAENIIENNPGITEEQLNYFVHRLLNRIIFLRISEDREHEPYERLKEIEDVTYGKLYDIFQEADEEYNSKLFDLLSKYSAENIDIDADIIAKVLEQLYYPQSPYTFAVVQSHIIGKIYDLFLGRSLTIKNGELEVTEKPEVEYSQGVVTTPKFIVEKIVEETITSEIQSRSPEDLEDFTIADICCGSGLFLTESYAELLDHYREWYIQNDPEDQEGVYRIGDEWRLTLSERQRILEKHLYGVDVDQLAVEVARFSLLLKILEDQPKAIIDHYIDRHGTPILPDLGDNIKNGNSLVDERFFEQIRNSKDKDEILKDVTPFNFESQFPVFERENGFSTIISNPPYVRIQNMVEYLREEEMNFYSKVGYETAQDDNYDRYSVFIERALDLLNENGSLGYIVPQKFLTLKSGRNLRKVISNGDHLSKLVHFGVEQIFENRSNYTCLLFLEKERQETFQVEKVSDLNAWINDDVSETITGNREDLTSEPWTFVGDAVDDLFARLKEEHEYTLNDVADIFVGAQTSCNLLYEIKDNFEEQGEYVSFEGPNGEGRKIEREILRPYFHTTNRFKPTIVPMTHLKPNGYIIYPYDEDGEIIPIETMQEKYPKAWEYFNDYRNKEVCAKRRRTLEERDLYNDDEEFYRYGRYQSIGKFVGEKIIVQVLSKEPKYGYDDSDVVVTGGGNGPFYNIRPYDNLQQKIETPDSFVSDLDIRYLMAVVCHPIIEAMVRSGSSFFRGGYYSHGKQFIKDVPIKMIDKNDEEEFQKYQAVIRLVQEHMDVYEKFLNAKTEKERQIHEEHLSDLRSKIGSYISNLYNLSEKEMEIAKTV